MLTGAFCEQPPLILIKSIEMAGCYIVDDDFMLVTRWLLDDVPSDANPLEDIRNTQRINAVVLNGRLFDRKALDKMLGEAEGAANR